MYREEKAAGEKALPSIDSIPVVTHDGSRPTDVRHPLAQVCDVGSAEGYAHRL